MEALLVLAGVAFGFGVGYLVRYLIANHDQIGIIHVNTSDPDGTYLFAELSTDLNAVMKKDYVIFKVEINKHVSQK